MRFKLDIELPDNFVGGLSVDGDPDISRVEKELERAAGAVEDVKARLTEIRDSIDAIRADVAAGRARSSELEDALRKRDAAALVIPDVELQEREVREKLQPVTNAARAKVIAEVEKRREQLQRLIDKNLAPLLERLREIDHELGLALAHARGEAHSIGIASVRLRWAQCIVDQAALSTWARAAERGASHDSR